MRIIIFLSLIAVSTYSNACMVKLMPDMENLDKYSQIYIAEVTGVHLFEYENSRAQSIELGENQMWFADFTLPHTVNAVVTKSFKGESSIIISHVITGCAVVTPSPHMMGLFFLDKEKGKVIPIYENEGKLYYELLIELGRKFR